MAVAFPPGTAGNQRMVAYRSMRTLIRVDNPPEVTVFFWRSYESDLERVIEVVLAPGLAALDVGANCGVVTIAMRAAVGPTGRVLSVDPSPEACRRVHEQAELNRIDNIEVIPAALGAEDTIAQYFRGRVGVGTLPALDTGLITREALETKVTTVDALIRSRRIDRIALMKIDTDGSECSVLEGAHATLRRQRPVVACECYPEGLRRRGRSPDDQAKLLIDAGYSLLRPRFRRSSRLLARPPQLLHFEPLVDLAELPEEGALNIVALHQKEPRHQHIFDRLTAGEPGTRASIRRRPR